MKANPLNAYRQTRVKTASQGRLIVMLYDEGVRQLDIAIEELSSDAPRLDLINNAIIKTQDVVTELMVSLDFEKGGDIAQNLFSLYTFFNQKLIEANLEKDPAILKDIRGLMKELRDAWAAIEKKGAAGGVADGGVNLAG